MARRKREEEWENHERWLVSYADFITLLFSFFVVMYAISSVNEGKYKVLSSTLVAAFSGQPWSPVPIRSGQAPTGAQLPLKLPPLPKVVDIAPVPQVPRGKVAANVQPPLTRDAAMDRVEKEIKSLLRPLIQQGSVAVHRTGLGVVLDINAKILFSSGQAGLTPPAVTTLTSVARVLRRLPYQIQVNGFTNDLPIHSPQFQSNWALSAIRAVSVVELFIQQGVNPDNLVAAGYGKYHPIAPNDTPEGLAMNRRVSIVIVAPQFPRKAGDSPIMAGAIGDRG